MNQQVKLIGDTELKNCLESGGVVALARVEAAEVKARGTRSQSAWIQATVLQAIHGQADEKIEVWRYVRDPDPLLTVGKSYVIAFSGKGEGNVIPFGLIGYVEVSPGDEEESVEAHKKAVERLLGSP